MYLEHYTVLTYECAPGAFMERGTTERSLRSGNPASMLRQLILPMRHQKLLKLPQKQQPSLLNAFKKPHLSYKKTYTLLYIVCTFKVKPLSFINKDLSLTHSRMYMVSTLYSYECTRNKLFGWII